MKRLIETCTGTIDCAGGVISPERSIHASDRDKFFWVGITYRNNL